MRYLVAIGGNALAGKAYILDRLARELGSLRMKGHQIVVTHGNGPQVGELALHEDLSLAELTAQTEAEIGVELEDSMQRRIGESNVVATVFTRVLVDRKDPSFRNPTKPIGPFYTKAEARKAERKGFTVRKLVGGYRRVVASPMPKKVLDAKLVEDLLSKKYIVIAGGGGGVAVFKDGNRLRYADAVIDKDYTSGLLARQLGVDALLFFTKTDGAYLDFGRRNQKRIGRISAVDLEAHLEDGAFEEGSMAPKIRTCIDFVRSTGKRAVIGSLAKPENVFKQKDVTVVTP